MTRQRVGLLAALRRTVRPPISRARAVELAIDECRRRDLPGTDDIQVYGSPFSGYHTVVVGASETDAAVSILVDKTDGHIIRCAGAPK